MAAASSENVRLHSLAVPLAPAKPEPEKKEAALSGAAFIVVYIFGSVISSCCIVVCCKSVFTRGFGFPLTVSFFGYLFTYLYYVVLQVTGAWKPEKTLPMIENVKVAAASIASISFMNLCLLTNPVAFYQIAKFVVIPCTLAMQATFFTINTNWKVLTSIAVLLGGVGYRLIQCLNAVFQRLDVCLSCCDAIFGFRNTGLKVRYFTLKGFLLVISEVELLATVFSFVIII